jgi:hypothetical protein
MIAGCVDVRSCGPDVRIGSTVTVLRLSEGVGYTPASRRSVASFNCSLGADSGRLQAYPVDPDAGVTRPHTREEEVPPQPLF